MLFSMLLLVANGLGATFADRFETGAHLQEQGRFDGREFAYRLFVPPTISGEDRALIVWLHGLGGAGTNNFSQLRDMEGPLFVASAAGHPECYVLAVQCPYEQPVWTSAESSEEGDMLDVTHDIIEAVVRDAPIDRDRIVLVGLCSGGSACWAFLQRYPQLFAACAPFNTSSIEPEAWACSNPIPLWVFQSAHDPTVATPAVRTLTYRLKRDGWPAEYAELDTATHDCWTPAFEQFGVLDWLLAQRRGETQSYWTSHGYFEKRAKAYRWLREWTWPEALLQAGYLILIGGTATVLLRLLRKGRHRSSHSQEVQTESMVSDH